VGYRDTTASQTTRRLALPTPEWKESISMRRNREHSLVPRFRIGRLSKQFAARITKVLEHILPCPTQAGKILPISGSARCDLLGDRISSPAKRRGCKNTVVHGDGDSLRINTLPDRIFSGCVNTRTDVGNGANEYTHRFRFLTGSRRSSGFGPLHGPGKRRARVGRKSLYVTVRLATGSELNTIFVCGEKSEKIDSHRL
jgi:hypothetical protein